MYLISDPTVSGPTVTFFKCLIKQILWSRGKWCFSTKWLLILQIGPISATAIIYCRSDVIWRHCDAIFPLPLSIYYRKSFATVWHCGIKNIIKYNQNGIAGLHWRHLKILASSEIVDVSEFRQFWCPKDKLDRPGSWMKLILSRIVVRGRGRDFRDIPRRIITKLRTKKIITGSTWKLCMFILCWSTYSDAAQCRSVCTV